MNPDIIRVHLRSFAANPLRVSASPRFKGIAMYILENPVLQRELLVNLRTKRAFVLLFLYNALLGWWWCWPGRRIGSWI